VGKTKGGTTMKALTICQPYAELILRGSKPVENRVWQTNYRGPLLIHAGKSRDWMINAEFGIPIREMAFGAIVGVADVTHCLSFAYLMSPTCDDALRYLRDSIHTSGPFCFVLKNPRRFAKPIPYRGAQGLFDIPDYVVQEALANVNSHR